MVEKKIEKLIEEAGSALDKANSQIIAGLSGLGGVYTLGPLNASYNKHKEAIAAADADAAATQEPGALTKNDNQLGKYLYPIAGAIPLVGAVTNTIAARQRWEQLERLNAVRKKQGLPPID